jgi:hypothetical protein
MENMEKIRKKFDNYGNYCTITVTPRKNVENLKEFVFIIDRTTKIMYFIIYV